MIVCKRHTLFNINMYCMKIVGYFEVFCFWGCECNCQQRVVCRRRRSRTRCVHLVEVSDFWAGVRRPPRPVNAARLSLGEGRVSRFLLRTTPRLFGTRPPHSTSVSTRHCCANESAMRWRRDRRHAKSDVTRTRRLRMRYWYLKLVFEVEVEWN